jgi:hypothetical protein
LYVLGDKLNELIAEVAGLPKINSQNVTSLYHKINEKSFSSFLPLDFYLVRMAHGNEVDAAFQSIACKLIKSELAAKLQATTNGLLLPQKIVHQDDTQLIQIPKEPNFFVEWCELPNSSFYTRVQSTYLNSLHYRNNAYCSSVSFHRLCANILC